MEPHVSVVDVSKRFGEHRVLEHVSLDIPRGAFVTLLGPSGCGKTTLLRVMAGFYEPDAGEIRFEGRLVNGVPPYARNTPMVFQDYALFPHMSVLENIEYGLRVKKVGKAERRKRAIEMLEAVRLADYGDRRPNQLSGGQRQRIALARALVNHPKVLLLDEPLGALDLKLREEMQVELKSIQRDVGITFVFVTHDQGEALSMSNRIAVFNNGRVEQVGTPRDIYDHPATAFVAGFVGISNVLTAERSQQLLGVAEPHSVRPERLRIVQHETGDTEISVPGVVSDIQYLGADCRVRVRLDDGTSMIASVPSDGLAGVAIGGNVRLAWSRDAAFPVANTDISKGEDS